MDVVLFVRLSKEMIDYSNKKAALSGQLFF